jgi:hypothetical protein
VCSNVGATFTITSGTGTCTVKFDQAGDGNYAAAAQVTESVSATKASQTITVTPPEPPATAVYNHTFTVVATGGGSTSPVTFGSAGSCSNTGATFTITSGTGTCTVTLDQAGDANYDPAPQVTRFVAAQPAEQTITVTQHAPAVAGVGSTFDVAAASSSGLAVAITTTGGCTGGGTEKATITITNAVGCIVHYNQPGNGNFSAAPEVTESSNVSQLSQTITFGALPGRTYGAPDFTVTASASSGLPVTFAASGKCTVAGATVHITGAGSCTITASQAGDATYEPAPHVPRSFTIAKAPLSVNPSPSAVTRQYSDPNPSFAAVITGFVNAENASVLTALPSCGTPGTPASPPGSYTITCAGGSAANYSFVYVGGTLTVTPEDARVDYVGASVFRTARPSSTAANVALKASIRDISAVAGDPAFDAFPGDIRFALVSFVDRETNTALRGCLNLRVAPDVPADARTGTVTCRTMLSVINHRATRYTIGIVVSGFYARDSSADDFAIKIAPPVQRVTLCYHGRTIRVTPAEAKKLRKRGAKSGACKRKRRH